MKVAVVCPYDVSVPGGVQNQAIELTRRLQDDDEAWLVAPGHLDQVPMQSIGRTVRVRANGSIVPIAIGPSAWGAVRRAVAGADICHIHEPFVPAVSLTALISAPRSVATFHAATPRWVGLGYFVGAPLGRYVLTRTRVSAVSPVAAAAIPDSWGPIELIPNGLDVAAFEEADRYPRRVVFIGRDEPRKGLDVLLRAWKRVATYFPDAELVIVGADRGDTNSVRYLGVLDEEAKRKVLASSGILVAPNTGGESFGIVLAEGMAAGCAVVASDLPAFRWVLGSSGTVFDTGNPVALADALTAVMADDRVRSEMSEGGRARVRQFDWDTVVANYRRLYVEALAR